jgi:hypothetical protein
MTAGMQLIAGSSVGSDGALSYRLKKGCAQPFNGIESMSPGGVLSSPESSGNIMSRCTANAYSKLAEMTIFIE